MNLHHPPEPCGTGVLVLAGSSGRVDTQRAALLARFGALALPIQWFGGPGQQPGPWEVPIETFTDALDHLAPEVDRLAIIGVSFGAEAGLVTATVDPRVTSVAAFAPTSVVWAGYDVAQQRETSHWTRAGRTLPYLPIIRETRSLGDPPGYRSVFQESMRGASVAERNRAAIRVEQIPDLLLVSGGDDEVWPSTTFAQQIIDRRARHHRQTRHVTHHEAGHRTLLPGERPPEPGRPMARGGTPAADAELGVRAWPQLCSLLQLNRI